jgi:hypothetical protein
MSFIIFINESLNKSINLMHNGVKQYGRPAPMNQAMIGPDVNDDGNKVENKR